LLGYVFDEIDIRLNLFHCNAAPHFIFEPVNSEELAQLGPEAEIAFQVVLLYPPEHLQIAEDISPVFKVTKLCLGPFSGEFYGINALGVLVSKPRQQFDDRLSAFTAFQGDFSAREKGVSVGLAYKEISDRFQIFAILVGYDNAVLPFNTEESGSDLLNQPKNVQGVSG